MSVMNAAWPDGRDQNTLTKKTAALGGATNVVVQVGDSINMLLPVPAT